MEYKDTLNLPRTGFSMKANLPAKEPMTLKDWEGKDIYSLIRKASIGKKQFVLHDGPPYANGNIHMGHALNKILKDIIVKYNTMKGMDAPYVPGWDCHGLPVEHQLFKELKLNKADIDQVDFRRKAHKYAMRFVKIQKEEFKRLGVFGDWPNPYITLNPEYEAGIIRSFGKLVGMGYIYKDLKPVNWCARCETALAEAEVEYADKTSPSIYVRFKIKNAKASPVIKGLPADSYFLIWTTTPWTLVANVAIALHPDLTYVAVDTGNGVLILAEELLNTVQGKLGLANAKVIKRIPGKKLEGIICRHPFIDRDSKVVLGTYVSHMEGTGCVHTAPGHGQEDHATGKRYNLPTIMPVNSKGLFDNTAGKFKGIFVTKANNEILKEMRSSGDLFYSEEITHSYPHCWRCKEPIIFRATEQYFMSIDKHSLRKKLLDTFKKVQWVPKTGLERISSMVQNRPDWCLSRQRYWGVPIPGFYCTECNELLLDAGVIEHVAGIIEKEGSNAFFRKNSEELLPPGTKCKKCKGTGFRKETDIVDVWFESGVSHQVVLKKRKQFPSDLYLEGSDQHRGWFQSSAIASFAIDKKPPYHAVLTHGFVVDGNGKKMSKSMGNVIAPQDIMKRYGADILRLWVASSDYNEDVRLSEEILKRLTDAYRKMRNTLKYLLSNIYDFDPKDIVPAGKMLDIDRWALCEAKGLLDKVTEYYEKYNFHMVYHAIYNFCTVTMSSIYLDILKDRLYTFVAASRERRSAQSAIYLILSSLIRVVAPVLSFTAEEAWSHMPDESGESVHLASWPVLDNIKDSKELSLKYKKLFEVREKVLLALEEKRKTKEIGSPLEARVILKTNDKALYKFLKPLLNELPSIFIVSQVEVEMAGAGLKDKDYSVDVNKAEGAKCQRCWNYNTDVGRNKEFNGLCARCAGVIRKIK